MTTAGAGQTWESLKLDLEKGVGKDAYARWIKPLELSNASEGVALFHVPTTFVGNYVDQNFGDLIIHHLRGAGVVVQRLQFQAQGQVTREWDEAPKVAEKTLKTLA